MRLLEAFSVSSIPFLGCDYETVYHDLEGIIPGEKVFFDSCDISSAIACEMICSAICHKINWDFLRHAVYKKSKEQPEWLKPESLANVTANEINGLLIGYSKPERIRAEERASLLREIGLLAKKFSGYEYIFLSSSGKVMPEEEIRKKLCECRAYSQDPEEKKLQLLFQKLSNYRQLSSLDAYCKPTIDYHLIRCFLRRGLISPKTKLSLAFVLSPEIQRRESTVGALRQLCADVVIEISQYTDMSIKSVNQIEWVVGRSICVEGEPDCYLQGDDAVWARKKYNKCPFFTTCCAVNFNPELLHIAEPNYRGSSY